MGVTVTTNVASKEILLDTAALEAHFKTRAQSFTPPYDVSNFVPKKSETLRGKQKKYLLIMLKSISYRLFCDLYN